MGQTNALFQARLHALACAHTFWKKHAYAEEQTCILHGMHAQTYGQMYKLTWLGHMYTNLHGLAICTNLPWVLNGDHTVSWANELTRVSTSSILAGPGKLAKKGLVVTTFINVLTCKIGSQLADYTQKRQVKAQTGRPTITLPGLDRQ